jgi:hypothetical protein
VMSHELDMHIIFIAFTVLVQKLMIMNYSILLLISE